MTDKSNKRHRTSDYELPDHIERNRRLSARVRAWKPRPLLPSRRLILAELGMSLLCTGMALVLWLPAQDLVDDLRSRGVSAAATVTDVDSKPKYVKVRLVSSPEAGNEVKLSDYAGKYPDTHSGASMIVTYDAKDPSRILARDWVKHPPVSLQTYLCWVLAFVFLGFGVALIFRRRWVLRQPEDPPTPSPQEVRLTKP
ncbi:hypothetical protein [Streptomyces sp. NPDC046909]|uniref:hypothetical protein n=1 Tax=Streptomyces sp. NPDC046909 TaxID=3155617 RepID=UPI0033E621CC